jgi:hypothetical protein
MRPPLPLARVTTGTDGRDRVDAGPMWTHPDRVGAPVRQRPWERAAHVALGIGFGAAALGNLIGFAPRANELLPWFAETAWLPPYPWVLNHLIQVAPLVVIAGAALEAVVAAMLLTRRHIALGLGLATAWLIGLIPAVGWPYWTPNLVLGSAVALLWIRALRSQRLTAWDPEDPQ